MNNFDYRKITYSTSFNVYKRIKRFFRGLIYRKVKERFNMTDFVDREIIDFADIKISKDFKNHYPNKNKMQERWEYYEKYKEGKVPIIVNENNVLIDGYTTYLIEKRLGIKQTLVKRI